MLCRTNLFYVTFKIDLKLVPDRLSVLSSPETGLHFFYWLLKNELFVLFYTFSCNDFCSSVSLTVISINYQGSPVTKSFSFHLFMQTNWVKLEKGDGSLRYRGKSSWKSLKSCFWKSYKKSTALFSTTVLGFILINYNEHCLGRRLQSQLMQFLPKH